MNFDWTEEQKKVREQVAGLFKAEALPNLETVLDVDALKGLLRKQLGRLAEAGYLDLGVGPGQKKEALGLMAAQEALSDVSGSLFLAVESSARLFGGILAGWGSNRQKAELLAPVRKGTRVGAVALSEPSGASGSLETVGEPDGDGVRLCGKKSFVTNGPLADCIAVAGRMEGKLAFFLVAPGDKGVSIGPRMNTLGYRGMAVSALELKDVRVKKERVIGPLADNSALDFLAKVEDLILAAASLGVIRRTYEAANSHAREHLREGKPVFAHQEVRFRVSDIFTLYQTSQFLAYRAAWFYGEGDPEADVLIHCAKVFTAESSEQVAQMSMQITAGQGYLTGNPVEQGYRDAKFAGLAGTTNELSRMLIADAMVRRFPV